ncbi:cilia- and flagella-associated protein 69 isoform X1 [Petromyzon marinus]|uniref:Cilia- and flagella-associated protein 69 isoform X1 n=1 Tax=Petromyzon marinus TaxID=7757 RepID=A0AAJ7WRQ7_PETMA|nr:cilia- and flagella-associated protein 69 isoform X1 [Petromyzon marinus]
MSRSRSDPRRGQLEGPVTLGRVAKLLEDPHCRGYTDRHISALKKALGYHEHGFPLRELVVVCRILNSLADLVGEAPRYTQPLCQLLRLLGKPFFKEKASDEMAYAQITSETIAQLGYLMRVSSMEVCLHICDSILQLCCRDQSGPEVPGYQRCRVEFIRYMLEQSGVAETLVLSLALFEAQQDVQHAVLRTLQHLSSHSAELCAQMVRARGAERLCSRLADPDPSGALLFRSVEVLWNLLENGRQSQVLAQLASIECVHALKEVLLRQVQRGFSHYDRQLRNDLLVLVTLIAHDPASPFLETGLTKQLVLLATFTEVKSHNPLVKNLVLTSVHEDFEMKKLLFNLLVVLSRDPCNIQLLSQGHVLLSLFHYSDVHEARAASGPLTWSPAQQEELQLQALAALVTLAPALPTDYMHIQGNTRLLLLLDWCLSKGPDQRQGTGVKRGAELGGKLPQLLYCIRVMHAMARLQDSSIAQDMCDQGTIGQLLDVCSGLMSGSRSRDGELVDGGPGFTDVVSLEIQTDALLTLSSLCQTDVHRKELFGRDGTVMLTKILHAGPHLMPAGLPHSHLVIAAIDAVWCCVLGCFSSEDIFLEHEGAFLLLDLLQVPCTHAVHSLTLSVLVELLDNPKAAEHVLAWRGWGRVAEARAADGAGPRDGATAPALLLCLWREEEVELGVPRGPRGVVLPGPQLPLVDAARAEQPVVPVAGRQPSQAVLNITENNWVKIYIIFSKIGFQGLPGLSPEDQVTLAIVERYMDFKVGEVWQEMEAELREEGVRPTTPDRDALETIARATGEVVAGVARIQAAILEESQEQELQDERQFYAEIKANHQQEEAAIKSWNHYVARTSNYEMLKEAQRELKQSIDSSRPGEDQPGPKPHSTTVPGLTTTTFAGRRVLVESTPAELTGGPLAATELALQKLAVKGGALTRTGLAVEQERQQMSAR